MGRKKMPWERQIGWDGAVNRVGNEKSCWTAEGHRKNESRVRSETEKKSDYSRGIGAGKTFTFGGESF